MLHSKTVFSVVYQMIVFQKQALPELKVSGSAITDKMKYTRILLIMEKVTALTN
ncbi:MAG: hypothetical protein ACI8VT_001562 [Saprospiraceae bacterium]|jgi:hypothetical protein